MLLYEKVKVAPRFQRAIQIDSDFGSQESLEGFVCPKSSIEALLSMTKHITKTGQSAFTWTGPYGSGKSSLALAFSSLMNGGASLRDKAVKIFGPTVAKEIWKSLPPQKDGWKILPVVGRRDCPAKVLGEALVKSELFEGKKRKWSDEEVVQALKTISEKSPLKNGGLIVFIDEMGKFLEASAQEGADVFLFQMLAEQASRSNGRLILIGILHQSFAEYSNRLSREIRDEWSKIQGRFIDLPINAAGEEQIEILGKAIESITPPKRHHTLAKVITENISNQRPGVSKYLVDGLTNCWPLHPVTAALLGPISRRRFGQNQRSLFGFLNSAEPFGFQDFLKTKFLKDLYEPHLLWDYLRANLEPAILASPDGHRWAIAAEAIDRSDAKIGDTFVGQLLKTIAVIDLFREHSGLTANSELLGACFEKKTPQEVEKGIQTLQKSSLVIHKNYLGSYAIFAGSDFDIEQAIAEGREEVGEINSQQLSKIVGFQPILAKRHFHLSGAMRWFEIDLTPLKEIEDAISSIEPGEGIIGKFILAIQTQNEDQETGRAVCKKLAQRTKSLNLVIGLSNQSWVISQFVFDLLALDKVRRGRAELAGDEVARREVQARFSELQAQLEVAINRAIDNAEWFYQGRDGEQLNKWQLNELASDIADDQFNKCPRLQNELLNRSKPSSSAVGAQNLLLRKMVTQSGSPNLGIEGFPAERGLLSSLLEAPGLYAETKNGWEFVNPGQAKEDLNNLSPIWKKALNYLQKNSSRAVSLEEIYYQWSLPPFGVKEGLRNVMAVAFILANSEKIAFYREGIFQAKFKEIDADYLAKDPSTIQLRWMDISDVSRLLLSGMAEIVRDLDKENTLVHLEPIDVARGLISIFVNLPPWTKRTMHLSSNAKKIRTIFKKAHDPNKFLFDDLPETFGSKQSKLDNEKLKSIIRSLHEGLEEMVLAYPTKILQIKNQMLAELQVPNSSPQALADLRERAENIRQLAGDFQLEAFVGRLAIFSGEDKEIEGICSLAVSKPPGEWVDADLDKAALEIADLCQRFNRSEAFARVKGRKDKRQAMAVVIGTLERPTPFLEEFEVTDGERAEIDVLVKKVEQALASGDLEKRNIILAALAEISARYIQAGSGPSNQDSSKGKRIQ